MSKLLKGFSIIGIVMLMFVCVMCRDSFAETITEEGNIWYGDNLSVEVTAGKNEYDFLSVYPSAAYEMSNHMINAGGTDTKSIPQTLMMIPAKEDYTWKPNGVYEFADNNYEVLYCCDRLTGYEDSMYYKRTNLEDSDYYTEEQAAYIRGIVTNSYPYVSVDQMKKNLLRDGFTDAMALDRSEIIAAVQAAIWTYANEQELAYVHTFDVPSNSQWGTVMHDYTNELNVWWKVGKRKVTTNSVVEKRINDLIKHLRNQNKVYAQKEQIVISKIDITGNEPVAEEKGTYTFAIEVELNNSGSSVKDEIVLDIYVDDTLKLTKEIILGTEKYEVKVKAKSGQTVKAVAHGNQVLPKGVYFYSPEGGRDSSQSLVGVAAGDTTVYATAEAKLDGEDFVEVTPDPSDYLDPEKEDETIVTVEPTDSVEQEETEEPKDTEKLVSVTDNNNLAPQATNDSVVVEEDKEKDEEYNTEKNDDTPETSDENEIMIYISMMIVSLMMSLGMLMYGEHLDKDVE